MLPQTELSDVGHAQYPGSSLVAVSTSEWVYEMLNAINSPFIYRVPTMCQPLFQATMNLRFIEKDLCSHETSWESRQVLVLCTK